MTRVSTKGDKRESSPRRGSLDIEEIVKVVGRIRGARFQQLVGERDKKAFDAREIVRESREIARGRSHF
jgi:hypothetical protein